MNSGPTHIPSTGETPGGITEVYSSSTRFHRQSSYCRRYRSYRRFLSVRDAILQGYVPCKKCYPLEFLAYAKFRLKTPQGARHMLYEYIMSEMSGMSDVSA